MHRNSLIKISHFYFVSFKNKGKKFSVWLNDKNGLGVEISWVISFDKSLNKYYMFLMTNSNTHKALSTQTQQMN